VIGAHSNGRLVEDQAFGSSLLELLGDARRRRASEAAGMLRAREFSLDVMIDRYEALLTQLCGAHARSIAAA
jgi:hypothetical protein